MSWPTLYPNGIITLPTPNHESWKQFFDLQKEELDKIQKKLAKEDIRTILPLPNDVFRALSLIELNKIKVVILGQDPYHTIESSGNRGIILATGLSFSIPIQAKIPSSLRNIRKNQIKFGHIKETPDNGSLESWCTQGCLLLNTSLTVTQGNPNIHKSTWRKFTDALIQYISDNTSGVVFMLWGRESLSKEIFIDKNKHLTTVSSHPSGFSYDKKMGTNGAFIDVDHFGIANNYLKNQGKDEIIW